MEDDADTGPQHNRYAVDTGFVWECPVCGLSRVKKLSDGRRIAELSLETHVFYHEGAGHGDHRSYPDRYPAEQLHRYVTSLVD